MEKVNNKLPNNQQGNNTCKGNHYPQPNHSYTTHSAHPQSPNQQYPYTTPRPINHPQSFKPNATVAQKSKLLFIIMGIILLCAVLIVGGILLYNSGRDSQPGKSDNPTPPPNIANNHIIIQGTTTIKVGDTATYTATIDSNNRADTVVEWKVLDSTFATIESPSGYLVAKKAGIAYISAKIDNIESEFYKVTITNEYIPVQTVQVNGTTTSKVGETTTYTATILPENATNQKIEWKLIDTDFGNINANGQFTPSQKGTAYIVATVDNIQSDIYKVTITEEETTAPPENNLSALRPEPMQVGENKIPEIMGSFTDGFANYYLLNAGYILNQYVGNMGIVHYNGQTPITATKTTVDGGQYTESITQTISESVTTTTSEGFNFGLKESVEVGWKLEVFNVKGKVESTQEWTQSVDTSSTKNKSQETNQTEMTEHSDTFSYTFTVGNNGEQAGWYRHALYSSAVDVLLLVQTSRDNSALEAVDTISIATTQKDELIPHFEYSPTPHFDNSPMTSPIDINSDFYKYLDIPELDEVEVADTAWKVYDTLPTASQWQKYTKIDFRRYDSSQYFETMLTIPSSVEQVYFLGSKHQNAFNIVASQRQNGIKIILDNFSIDGIDTSKPTLDLSQSPTSIIESKGETGILAHNGNGNFGQPIKAKNLIIRGNRGDMTISADHKGEVQSANLINGHNAIEATNNVNIESKGLFNLNIYGGNASKGGNGGNGIKAGGNVSIFGKNDSTSQKINIFGGDGSDNYTTVGNGGSGGAGILCGGNLNISTLTYVRGGKGALYANSNNFGRGGDGGAGISSQGLVSLNASLDIQAGDAANRTYGDGGNGGNGVEYKSLVKNEQYTMLVVGGKGGGSFSANNPTGQDGKDFVQK